MAKKTIPQLQEATEVTDNAFMVVDTGSVTKKIKVINLKKSMKKKTVTISLTSQVIPLDVETILFQTPDAPAGMDAYLPPAADCDGWTYQIKNIGTGQLGIYPNDPAETIDGATELDMSTPNMARTLVSNGSKWFIIN